MNDKHKTKDQFLLELTELRRQLEKCQKDRQRQTEEFEALAEKLRAATEHQMVQAERAAGALEFERRRFFEVLDRMPAHVSLLRPDHTFAFVNGEFVRRFGDPGSKRCYELMGRQSPCEECQGMEVFHTGTPVAWEWTSPAGRYYQNYHYPFTDVDGSPLVLEMGIDITERKQAEEILEARLKLLRLAESHSLEES